MPTYHRLFVIENGETVLIQDETGDQLSIVSLDELERITGHSHVGKHYVGYEPGIEMFVDSEDPTISEEDIPNAKYEAYIDNISILRQRLDDPLYGLAGQALADKQAELDAIAAEEARVQVIEDAIDDAGIRDWTPDEAKTKIQQMFDNAANDQERLEVIITLFKKTAVHLLR